MWERTDARRTTARHGRPQRRDRVGRPWAQDVGTRPLHAHATVAKGTTPISVTGLIRRTDSRREGYSIRTFKRRDMLAERPFSSFDWRPEILECFVLHPDHE